MFKCIFNIYIKMYFFNVHKKPWTDTEDTSKNATCQSVGEGRPVQGWTWDLTSPHPSFFIFILENFKATEKLRKKLNIEHPYILCLDSLINR